MPHSSSPLPPAQQGCSPLRPLTLSCPQVPPGQRLGLQQGSTGLHPAQGDPGPPSGCGLGGEEGEGIPKGWLGGDPPGSPLLSASSPRVGSGGEELKCGVGLALPQVEAKLGRPGQLSSALAAQRALGYGRHGALGGLWAVPRRGVGAPEHSGWGWRRCDGEV